MLGLVLGVFVIILGAKAFTPNGLPLTKNKQLTGTSAMIVGVVCIVFGVALIADGLFASFSIINLLSGSGQNPPSTPTAVRIQTHVPPQSPTTELGTFPPHSLPHHPAISQGVSRYHVTMTGNATGAGSGGSVRLVGHNGFRYRWDRSDNAATLRILSLKSVVKQGDTVVLSVKADASSMTTISATGKTTITPETAVDAEDKNLFVGLSMPAIKVEYNTNGGVDMQTLVEVGNALRDFVIWSLFLHGPFIENQKSWTAPAQYAMGNGGIAAGKITYRRLGAADDKGVIAVTCKGEFKGEVELPTRSELLKRATYIVTGNLKYDTNRHRWIAASLVTKVSSQIIDPFGTVRGTTASTQRIELALEKKGHG